MRVGRPFVLVLAAALIAAASPPGARAQAPLSSTLIDTGTVAQMRDLMQTQIVLMSLRGANRQRGALSQAQIEDYDARWRREREAQRKPLISSTLSNPLSNYLTRVQAHSGGSIVEIIVVGSKGLNVGQSSITSDMWQGDEAKFQETAAIGAGTVFIDEAEWHAQSGTWRAQLNMSIDDPDTGAAIGAATIEINLTELERRRTL